MAAGRVSCRCNCRIMFHAQPRSETCPPKRRARPPGNAGLGPLERGMNFPHARCSMAKGKGNGWARWGSNLRLKYFPICRLRTKTNRVVLADRSKGLAGFNGFLGRLRVQTEFPGLRDGVAPLGHRRARHPQLPPRQGGVPTTKPPQRGQGLAARPEALGPRLPFCADDAFRAADSCRQGGGRAHPGSIRHDPTPRRRRGHFFVDAACWTRY